MSEKHEAHAEKPGEPGTVAVDVGREAAKGTYKP